jgi:drug/metabolite transporter (DMT)-like permease
MAWVLLFLNLTNVEVSPVGVFLAILSGAIASGIGYFIWYSAPPRLAATHAATVQLSVPVLAAFGGVLFLSESITFRLLTSSFGILLGIGLVLLARGEN